MDLTELYGRRQLFYAQGQTCPAGVEKLSSLDIGQGQVRCRRCGQVTAKQQAALPRGQYYCPTCINLGRVDSLGRFYHVPEPNQFTPPAQPLQWHGQLSAAQGRIAAEIKTSMGRHEHRLLWAVTGAGKTEMIFPAIDQALRRRERVGIASPRVDVCLELYPRLQAAFPQVPIALLHGRAKEAYHYRQLTICTTHQLLRFYHAFDLLIVDEVDAFPYACNAALLHATGQAVKPVAGLLLMSATPGKLLLQRVRTHRLACSCLPLRYHGHPLPEIHGQLLPHWRRSIQRGKLPRKVKKWIQQRLDQQQEFLLFVPHVADLGKVAPVLKAEFNLAKVVGVHAADPDRLAKVQAMRDHRLPFLVTTTIMERGVTFPKIDVAVLGADDPVFSSSALVQMAGRAGRSAARPTGDVVFWLDAYSLAVKQAQAEIKLMNYRGRMLKNELLPTL